FLRRAGWRVALVTSLKGSFEGSPPTLFDIAVRDRRWMQGNLQHAAVIAGRGITPISRLHLGIGIFAYLSSALWACMILTGLHLIWREDQRSVSYFGDAKTLFPDWPVFDPELGLSLLAATLAAVFLPKVLGLGVELYRNAARRTSWIETAALIAMWWAELIFSALMAPVYMLMQVRALVQIVLGQDSGWNPQNREGAEISFSQALHFHWWHVAVGAVIAAFCLAHSWYALAWISPIVAGLVLSPLLTAWSSRRTSGQRVGRTADDQKSLAAA
ncbi:MAG: glycosyltransferase family 2 protein, partial [Pseudomonadota bacterium]